MRNSIVSVSLLLLVTPVLHGEDGGSRPAVCVAESSRTSLLLPAVAHVDGKFGTAFVSDVSIANYRSIEQRVRARWLPESGVVIERYLTLPPRTTLRYKDFAATELQVSGVGALLLESVLSDGGYEEHAHIDATSRIWTTLPGSTGTTSQTLSSRATTDLSGATAARAMGMTQDENFRTNVGIVNLETDPLTFSIRVEGSLRAEAFTITVAAMSLRQIAIPDGVFGDTVISIFPLTTRADAFPWSAYAVSLDNRTGDGWVVHAVQP